MAVIPLFQNGIDKMLEDMRECELVNCVVIGVDKNGALSLGYDSEDLVRAVGLVEMGKQYMIMEGWLDENN